MNINEAKKKAENTRRMSDILAKLSTAPNKNAKKRAAAELSRIGIESALKLAPVSEAEELFADFDVLSEDQFAMKYSGVLNVPVYEDFTKIAKNHMKTRAQIDAFTGILSGSGKPKAPKTEVFPGSTASYKEGLKTVKHPDQIAAAKAKKEAKAASYSKEEFDYDVDNLSAEEFAEKYSPLEEVSKNIKLNPETSSHSYVKTQTNLNKPKKVGRPNPETSNHSYVNKNYKPTQSLSEGPFSSGHLTASGKLKKEMDKIPSSMTFRGKDEKGGYTQVTKNGVKGEKVYDIKEGAGDLSDEARELTLHADNDHHLHMSSHEPIMTNLRKKVKAGKYDPALAKKLWRYHADRAAQDYAKKHGDGTHWTKMFTPKHRDEAASHWEEMHRGELSESKNAFTKMDQPGAIASRVSTRVISDSKARKKAARDANKPPKVDKKGNIKNPTPNVLNPPAVTRVARPKEKAPGVVRGITVPIKKIAGEAFKDVVGAIKNRNQPYERLQENEEMTKQTPYTASKRNLNVERDIVEIMSQNRDVRMEARLADARASGILVEENYGHPDIEHDHPDDGGPDLSVKPAGQHYEETHGLRHPSLPMRHHGFRKSTGVMDTGHDFLKPEHIHAWHEYLKNASPEHHKEMVEHFTGEAKNRSTHLAAVNSRSILEHHYKNLLLDHKEHLAAAKSTEEKAAVHTRLKQAHDAVANSPYTDIDNIHRTVQHLQKSRAESERVASGSAGKSKD